MTKRRSTFGKMQRERDKAAKQEAKRERRTTTQARKADGSIDADGIAVDVTVGALEATAEDGSPLGTDEQALLMRRRGKSFSAIARDLGLARANEAGDAFLRAVRQRPPAEADTLRREEEHRLDRLTEHVNTDATLDTAEVAKRLRTIERLRTMMAADPT